jgi:hypothetical protein
MTGYEKVIAGLSGLGGTRVDRAVIIASALKRLAGKPDCTIKEICDAFEVAHLARPNSTVLSQGLKADRRVSCRSGVIRALANADQYFDQQFPDIQIASDAGQKLDAQVRVMLGQTPFIDEGYVTDLEKMISLYAQLHTLENSIRRLIEKTLLAKFGTDWWTVSASSSAKKKHDDRLQKEQTRKWLPSRSSLGPLYSLDWSDLISIMRKFECDFVSYLGEIDFLHRFNDLGLLRHVVAHHGFVDDQAEFERVKLALRDWQKQVGSALVCASKS